MVHGLNQVESWQEKQRDVSWRILAECSGNGQSNQCLYPISCTVNLGGNSRVGLLGSDKEVDTGVALIYGLISSCHPQCLQIPGGGGRALSSWLGGHIGCPWESQHLFCSQVCTKTGILIENKNQKRASTWYRMGGTQPCPHSCPQQEQECSHCVFWWLGSASPSVIPANSFPKPW